MDLGSTVFFDYVKSKLNPADVYTRVSKGEAIDSWLRPRRWQPVDAISSFITLSTHIVPLEGRTMPGEDPSHEIFPEGEMGMGWAGSSLHA